MHKTFYIDVDEEVTSIIDRLKKSSVNENILVIPQRALILQSIVNLKLLKKEAEKNKKQVMIITQDAHGQALVERAGILVQSSMEGIEEENAIGENFQPKINDDSVKEKLSENMEKKEKLKSLGSGEFFDISPRKKEATLGMEKIRQSGRKKPKIISAEGDYNLMANFSNSKDKKNESDGYAGGLDPKKERGLERLFGEKPQEQEKKINSNNDSREKKVENGGEIEKTHNRVVSSKARKVFFFLGIICFFSIFSVGVYLFFPKVDVEIYPQTNVKKADLEIEAFSNEDASDEQSGMVIPCRVVEADSSISFSFEATGKKNISDQKAHGTVTLYNGYNSDLQQLVATTRLLTEEGRMFRLVESVVIPGISEIDGKSEPGTVEAEVVADQSGEEYNIEASEFSIPGFKGSPKYGKIYAKSSTKMIGGGSTGMELNSVSENDIASAKKKTEDSARNELKERINGKLEEGEVVLDSSIKEDFINSIASPGAGMVADDFSYQVDLRAKAIVVSQRKIDKLIEDYFAKNGQDGMDIAQIKVEYGNIDADFEKNNLTIRLNAEVLLQNRINLESLKTEVLGKNTSQLREIVDKNNQIKKVELSFYPDFLRGRIPSQGKWVNIKLIEPSLE
ncbi:MAG: Uncharacterized protein Athens071425_160 [Parcubacteria group bacterium Athens0714_25]|nr:MAG: Uncharacterized protein Athens071425_160 [Parcubacteria group bacterium Athens0714_25]